MVPADWLIGLCSSAQATCWLQPPINRSRCSESSIRRHSQETLTGDTHRRHSQETLTGETQPGWRNQTVTTPLHGAEVGGAKNKHVFMRGNLQLARSGGQNPPCSPGSRGRRAGGNSTGDEMYLLAPHTPSTCSAPHTHLVPAPLHTHTPSTCSAPHTHT